MHERTIGNVVLAAGVAVLVAIEGGCSGGAGGQQPPPPPPPPEEVQLQAALRGNPDAETVATYDVVAAQLTGAELDAIAHIDWSAISVADLFAMPAFQHLAQVLAAQPDPNAVLAAPSAAGAFCDGTSVSAAKTSRPTGTIAPAKVAGFVAVRNGIADGCATQEQVWVAARQATARVVVGVVGTGVAGAVNPFAGVAAAIYFGKWAGAGLNKALNTAWGYAVCCSDPSAQGCQGMCGGEMLPSGWTCCSGTATPPGATCCDVPSGFCAEGTQCLTCGTVTTCAGLDQRCCGEFLIPSSGSCCSDELHYCNSGTCENCSGSYQCLPDGTACCGAGFMPIGASCCGSGYCNPGTYCCAGGMCCY